MSTFSELLSEDSCSLIFEDAEDCLIWPHTVVTKSITELL